MKNAALKRAASEFAGQEISNLALSEFTVAAATHRDLEHLKLRAWARAKLFRDGELELQEAVDVLQDDAERKGLVIAFGQDAIQAIIAREFEAVR